ncbi:FKBP12-associated protein [Entomophthora muscae]|uniref:FKBP12-associated protein n=1 Tax=Entomophthora muscae TaxID=34485 RepID=A0ACC2THN9_9FUNG|nr:FKBP12-associated protein [Entomophthora muscae]
MNTSEHPHESSSTNPLNGQNIPIVPFIKELPEKEGNSKGKRRARTRKPKQKPAGHEASPSEIKPRHNKGHSQSKPKASSEGPSNQNACSEISKKSKNFKERMEKFSCASKSSEAFEFPLGLEKQKLTKKNRQPKNQSDAPTPKSCHQAVQDYSTEDLRTKLTFSLTDASYECMVCWETVKPKNFTWSCQHCWAVFHLPCVKRWSQSSEKNPRDLSLGPIQFGWRCPGCQTVQIEQPSKYMCFCGKVSTPEYNKFVTPHSCSQPCQKQRGASCPHPCPEPCHPGPCPPCTAMSPPTSCYCGQNIIQGRCGEHTDIGYSCFNKCRDLLGCGKHLCTEPCHDGTCPPCKEEEEQPCYCGQHSRVALCGSGIQESSWVLDPSTRLRVEILGYYSCHQPCKQSFDCNVHSCLQLCHSVEKEPVCCPRSPMVVNTCPCGQTLLPSIISSPRKVCTDDIPVCSKQCSKHLNCNHFCQESCHEGECPPCAQLVKLLCQCGATMTTVPCSESKQDILCDRVCHQKKTCGKHKCSEICCPFSKNSSNFEPHICFELCNKMLNCKTHFCSQLCHKGACKPCMEASFDDLSCSCGRTVRRAPIPCGAEPPECNFPCCKPRQCGHSIKLAHNCHSDTSDCPPCTALTTKLCRCGKKDVKNIPCFRQSPSCGLPCGKLLACGAHVCKEVCHDGPCLKLHATCKSVCQKPLQGCEHPCQLACHAPSMCPAGTTCVVSVQIPCECGRRKVTKPCNGQPLLQRQPVACDKQCLIEIRNKKFAEALGISNTIPTSDVTTQYDRYIFVFITPTQLKWVKEIEQKINSFVNDTTKTVLHFSPMRDFQRKFLHCISANYQVQSLSLDDPPNKSVQYTKTPQTKIPAVLPSEAYKSPEKYMLAEEEVESDLKPARQAVNMILLKNTELSSTVSNAIQNSLFATDSQADVFMYGNNIVIKPQNDNPDVVQHEDAIRILFYQVRSALNSANVPTKACLGWVNAALEVVWPKLETATPLHASRSVSISTTNKFSFLSESSSNASQGVHQISPKKENKPKEPKSISRLPVSVPEEVVEDWTELI